MQRFDRQASALLLAAGFIPEFYPAQWEDVGDAENGPRLDGYPDTLVYTLELPPSNGHCAALEVVVLEDKGTCSEMELVPLGPVGWDEQF